MPEMAAIKGSHEIRWPTMPLRRVAEVRNSNVDKLSHPGEVPVRLCNYVDVYRNDLITGRIEFMRATATAEEVAKFKLRRGDVLITKDSELWTDIGVPAIVKVEADDLVCGYHLTMLRARQHLMWPGYLARALRVPEVAVQLHLAAKGVTRFGLTQQGIKSALVPVPPLDAQQAMTRYLDHLDLRVGRAVNKKHQLVQLLDERRRVVSQELVTRGLRNPGERRASGVDWLGEVPAHWDVRPAKWFYREVNERSQRGEEQLISVSHLTGVTPRASKNVTMFMAASYAGHKLCRPGDLVINTMWAWMGALGVAADTGIISPAYGVYRPLPGSSLHPAYADLLLRTRPYIDEYTCRSTGIRSSRLRLYPDRFLTVPIVCPPGEEQQEIVVRVADATRDLNAAIAATMREIELLQEYRARLIADVVTGRRDVWAQAASLPDVDPEELDAVLAAASTDDDDIDDDEE
ncbi:restriction endonuclease subunit S [Micromonospora sp. NPDC005206]|uniref:restriction endonuclease subunit S n=1 Tax=Micromonospora sp. NPDC005206 TaxID=3157022 RepID=UPI00339E525F